MKRRSTRLIPVMASAALLAWIGAGSARAQFVPPPGGGASASNASSSNSIGMSLTNPFLNPYAAALSQQPLDTGTMAMYFMAARQASGGIGTGVPSGTRPGSAHGAKEHVDPNAPRKNTANVPGAMASRYFNRTTPVYQGTKRYYNRQERYYPSTGQVR